MAEGEEGLVEESITDTVSSLGRSTIEGIFISVKLIYRSDVKKNLLILRGEITINN